ncbi:hypothetical protein FGU65_02080 [Methanoculleus sp. FWC-SCC1]|uniref:ZIP Zinc transporter n=1 Tax=Methanoculleus frigidifontis TaxID=2584085 RepID=A0ABT8M6Y5_9EURY|nr:hypothetical protein [Methanoculleus sp. FWC-SCC1]MDN7023696.1 hypothetical protein [Methanoculleus sp. FWC-SCC1]
MSFALSLIPSTGAVILSGIRLLFPGENRLVPVPVRVGYAAGTLLGAAFLALIPETLEELPADAALATVRAGVLLFFTRENLMIRRHGHEEDDAYETSTPPGIAISFGVIAHEVLQEGELCHLLKQRLHGDAGVRLRHPLQSRDACRSGFRLLLPCGRRGVCPSITALAAAGFIAIADLFPTSTGKPAPGRVCNRAEGFRRSRRDRSARQGICTGVLLHDISRRFYPVDAPRSRPGVNADERHAALP